MTPEEAGRKKNGKHFAVSGFCLIFATPLLHLY
jgi:hypothetical protein